MKALITGQRNGSVGVVLGLAGVICLLIASVGLNLKHRSDLTHLHSTIYHRCLDRQQYDQLSNRARSTEIVEWRRLARLEPPSLRRDAYTRMADAMQAAVNGQVRGGCNLYR